MNYFKRATTSLKRRPVKSIIFLVLIIILGTLTAGAITVREAITNTDANLRRRMPAIMMVEAVDWTPEEIETAMATYEETGIWPLEELPALTPELIREIADLPYIQFYDYAIDVGWWSVTSNDLQPWTGEEIGVWWPVFMNYTTGLGANLRPRGVSAPDFIEARAGLLELTSGRTFTEEELTHFQEITPIIMSSELARINNLEVGSIFDSRLTVWDSGGVSIDGTLSYEEQGLENVVDETFLMEVIGIFEAIIPEIPLDQEDVGFAILNQVADIYRRIYIPNIVAEVMFDLLMDAEVTMGWREDHNQPNVLNFFTLTDPANRTDFIRAIDQLEGNWQVIDLSTGFSEISTSMSNISELADYILIGSVGATILIVSLLVLLFLRDRKHEIGVYLAMGEVKSNIIKQIILELMPLALIGLTFALLIGSILSTNISQEMIRQDLLANPPTQMTVQEGGMLEQLGYRFRLTHEEMLDSYDITLDGTTIGLFYGIGLATVFISTLVPVIVAVTVDPKQLLMTEQTQ